MLGGAAGRVFRGERGCGRAEPPPRVWRNPRGRQGCCPTRRAWAPRCRPGFRCLVPAEGRAALRLQPGQGAAEPGACVRRRGGRGSDRTLNLRGREGVRGLFW